LEGEDPVDGVVRVSNERLDSGYPVAVVDDEDSIMLGKILKEGDWSCPRPP
jgi:hypothetical protein